MGGFIVFSSVEKGGSGKKKREKRENISLNAIKCVCERVCIGNIEVNIEGRLKCAAVAAASTTAVAVFTALHCGSSSVVLYCNSPCCQSMCRGTHFLCLSVALACVVL